MHSGFFGVSAHQLQEAHERDLEIEQDEGVHFERAWLDPESGRKSLLICSGIYLLAYCYYRFVLMRRPEGWVMTGPEDIDARARDEIAAARGLAA